MPDQQSLPPTEQARIDPLTQGLWSRLTNGFYIDHSAWMRACAEGHHVGTCRRCGDYLVPRHPDQVGNRTDYEANCRVEACGWTLNAPGGRILTRSSRHNEMPSGWWDRRTRTLTKTNGGDD